MMGRGLFITGTDTGVGKTVVTAAVLSILRRASVDAVPMKPVQTGCVRRGGMLSAPDLDFTLKTVDLVPSRSEQRLMCPYRFEPACSPHLAAALAKQPISTRRIESCFRALAQRHEIVVVEGAGGILAPLSKACTMLDLVKALHLPVLLVSRPGLGTINHTLLTLREIRRAGVRVLGIVFSHAQVHGNRHIEEDNVRTIASMGGCGNIWTMPFIPATGRPALHMPRDRRLFSRMPSADAILDLSVET